MLTLQELAESAEHYPTLAGRRFVLSHLSLTERLALYVAWEKRA